ncbi:MAG: hypothetical protein QM756_37165 [Polyangiaceae bacterium]
MSRDDAYLGSVASVGAAVGALLLSRLARAAQPKLLVFLHVAAKQRALQNELSQALSGVSVTAVGRIADFERSLVEGQDAVLSLPVVLTAHKLTPKLRGQRQGSGDEKYSLIGPDTAPDPARVSAVGALDLLGREATSTFVHSLLGAKPKVERVTKVEDLLPLLQMRRVEAIVLPSRLFAEIRAASRLNLAGRELGPLVGLPAAADVGAGGAQVLSQLSKLPKALSKSFGVEEWR